MSSKTRRNIIALLGGGVALGLTGGAVVYAKPEGTTHVIVNNQTSSEQAVTTVIRTSEEEEILVDETQTIPASEEQGYMDLVADKPLLVTIRTENGLEDTYRWTSTAAENGLSVGITTDQVGFEVATLP